MSSFITLIEIAKRSVDKAALRLGNAIQANQELENKLNLLKNYRQEYASKMQSQLKKGCEIQRIHNFQLFIDKIDTAIRAQQQLIMQAQKRILLEQQHWQQQELQRISYVKLNERANKLQRQQEARRDQLQNDEFGIRQLFYK